MSKLSIPSNLVPSEYKRLREERGTQQAVADALGIHKTTIARRESEHGALTREMFLALLNLPERARDYILPEHKGEG